MNLLKDSAMQYFKYNHFFFCAMAGLNSLDNVVAELDEKWKSMTKDADLKPYYDQQATPLAYIFMVLASWRTYSEHGVEFTKSGLMKYLNEKSMITESALDPYLAAIKEVVQALHPQGNVFDFDNEYVRLDYDMAKSFVSKNNDASTAAAYTFLKAHRSVKHFQKS
jgi:hypothetical protein